MEPRHFLYIHNNKASNFLNNKLQLQCKTYILFNFSAFLLLLINYLSIYYIIISVLIYNILLLLYYILLKYACYNGDSTATAKRFLLILGYLSIIVPILIPVITILTTRNYVKIRQHLKLLLNEECGLN